MGTSCQFSLLKYVPKSFLSVLFPKILLLFWGIGIVSFGQKQVSDQQLTWNTYMFAVSFPKQWGAQFETGERFFWQPMRQYQTYIRTNVNYTFPNSTWGAMVGGAWFLQSANSPHLANYISISELRPYFGFTNKQPLKYFNIEQRYQVESRFFQNTNADKTALASGFHFGNFRFRYRLQFLIPILKLEHNRELRLRTGTEIFFNAGKNIVYNVFDQSRVFTAFQFRFSPKFTIELGYLNSFQQTPAGKTFYQRHFWLLNLIFNFTITKPKANSI
ncbi:MAG: DUF2490 domain-containing protein [Bacteroidia bacterium]|nr:DUF2490 domain-containing protein [Bacteroidia bacterium]